MKVNRVYLHLFLKKFFFVVFKMDDPWTILSNGRAHCHSKISIDKVAEKHRRGSTRFK